MEELAEHAWPSCVPSVTLYPPLPCRVQGSRTGCRVHRVQGSRTGCRVHKVLHGSGFTDQGLAGCMHGSRFNDTSTLVTGWVGPLGGGGGIN